MDGSSGPAAVIPKAGFAFLLATCGVAFAVSGTKASPSRAKGLALFENGDCRGAVPELLRALAEGDSSHVLVLNLAQALDCDGRSVDALSATYVDARTDTTGRIDALLYRAQLLRKLGLDDEAEKAEREAGIEMAAGLSEPSDETDTRSWSWSPSLSGSVGWMLQEDAVWIADSLRWISSKIGVKTDVADKVAQPLATADDSVHILGRQLPVSANLGVEIDGSNWYLWVGVPLQATLKTDLSGWLATSGRVLAQLGGAWSIRWVDVNASLSASRNWTFYPGYDPLVSSDFAGVLECRRSLGETRISQANTGSLALDSSYGFGGFSAVHSVVVSRPLPWKFEASAGAGFSWYLDKSRTEFDHLSDFRVKVIDVEGIETGMANTNTAIQFLDSAGVVIPHNSLNNGRIRNGIHPAQRVAILDGYDYPLESRMDWHRWNLGIGLSKGLPAGFTARMGLDVARTELLRPQRGTFVPELSLYNDRWAKSGDLILFRDVHTGVEYWDGDPASGSFVGPISFERRRIDRTTTITGSLVSPTWHHMSANLSGSWIANRSNLGHLVEGSSYTRSLWNASVTVSW